MSSAWWGPTSAKGQFLRRLHRRVGHPFLLSFDPPFRFETAGQRWRNLHQLEAVVEFYVNFPEPWGAGQVPRKPGDPAYVPVSLGEPRGSSATVAGTVVQLEGNPSLQELVVHPPDAANPVVGPAVAAGYPPRRRYLYDTIWLGGDRARTSRMYRIMQVDDDAKTVTVDAAPMLREQTSNWRVNRRPIVVMIDPFGARVRGAITLSGAGATIVGPDPLDATRTIVQLDAGAQLERVNDGFDTIHLPSDQSTSLDRPGTIYRIFGTNQAARQVTVIGSPNFGGGTSNWEIPAGVSGGLPPLAYDLGPHHAPANADRQSRGFDHYDGALFIVHRGRISGRGMLRWSSYTSRDKGPWNMANWPQALSSVRANARYYYSAYRSADDFKNYTFGVIDAVASRGGLTPVPPHAPAPPAVDLVADNIADARFYFGTPAALLGLPAAVAPLDGRVTTDANGKSLIRFHRGSQNGRVGTGSDGCIVSPSYVDMRSELVRRYEADYEEFYGPGALDGEVHKLLQFATTNAGSENLYNGMLAPPNAGVTLTAANWNDRLCGVFWLIRPDERPLGP